MPAEMIAYRGLNKYEVITDDQLDEAINKLNLVMSCAQSIIDNPKGDLLPVNAKNLFGDNLSQYTDDLIYFMGEFKISIEGYQNLFVSVRATKQEKRDFNAIFLYTKEQDILIERAHKKLME